MSNHGSGPHPALLQPRARREYRLETLEEAAAPMHIKLLAGGSELRATLDAPPRPRLCLRCCRSPSPSADFPRTEKISDLPAKRNTEVPCRQRT